MEEKVTAVYLLVWKYELTAADRGNFERPLAAQKEKCLLSELETVSAPSGVSGWTLVLCPTFT